jgi:hypothetical protein
VSTNPKLPIVHGTGGRPAYSDDVRRKIIAALKIGATRTAAYQAAGIGTNTFYRWMNEDSSFREAVENAEGLAELAYTRDIRMASRERNPKAAAFWLERRRRKDWGRIDTLVVAEPSIEDRLDEEDEATLRELLRHLRATGGPSTRGEGGEGAAPEEGPA